VAIYRIRHLHCLQCDEPVRARNQLVDDVEIASRCPGCGGVPVSLGALNMKPDPALRFTRQQTVYAEFRDVANDWARIWNEYFGQSGSE
jgi:hypothetical protein